MPCSVQWYDILWVEILFFSKYDKKVRRGDRRCEMKRRKRDYLVEAQVPIAQSVVGSLH